MDILLNNYQVEDIVGSNLPVVLYEDFNKVNDIDELFGLDDVILVCFDWKRNNNTISGHWCGLSRYGNNIAFYDPYGRYIDDQLKFIPEHYREQYDMVDKHLSKLLVDSRYKKIHYNPHRHQQQDKKINTCGRHTGLFLRSGLDPEEYHDIMKTISDMTGLSLDELSVQLTEPLISNI